MALYNLTFKIDGEIFRVDSVEGGLNIPTPEVPEREGYDFAGWENLPEVMPEGDLTVQGSFTADSYTLTVMADEEVWATYSFSSGEDISEIPLPEREGYTFGGWVKKYKKMPRSNLTLRGSFRVNCYTLAFELDDMTFEQEMEYGAPLDFIMEPERDNYVFSGWGEIPATMPAHDLRFHGSFAPHLHTLTFVLDGKPYRTEQLTIGAPITAPEVPERAGLVFGGWRRLPDTMPGQDVTVEGKFRTKKYRVTFMVGDKKYTTASFPEGAKITPPEPPVIEGKTFRGWRDMPPAMPARNIELRANFREEAKKA